MFNYDAIDGNQFTLTAVITGDDDLSFVDGYLFPETSIPSRSSRSASVTYKTQFLGPTFFDPINEPERVVRSVRPSARLGSIAPTVTFKPSCRQGTYTITVQDLCGSHGNPACPGFPAGWGIRLDAVPELSTWALMLVGTTGLGAALRRRRQVAAA